MKTSIVLAAGLAALPVPICPAASAAGTRVVAVRAFLCDSADHAIQFADVVAKGEGEEVAKDRVGRLARAEVCGRYTGVAAVESEAVMLKGGVAYKITAYRFVEDGRQAFGAETTFAPVTSGWDL